MFFINCLALALRSQKIETIANYLIASKNFMFQISTTEEIYIKVKANQ